MKRSSRKRTAPSKSEAAAISEEGTSNNDSKTTNENTVEGLPPWRAESILSKRSTTTQQTKTDSTINNTVTSYVPGWSICENDWWESNSNDNNEVTYTNNVSNRNDCHSDSSSTTGERQRKRSKRRNQHTQSNSTEKKFYNIGLHVWNTSRAQWTSYKSSSTPNNTTALTASSCSDSSMSEATTPGKSGIVMPRYQRSLTSNQYRELVRGLANVTREYLLPKPMNLADLIEVYVDIWDNSHE